MAQSNAERQAAYRARNNGTASASKTPSTAATRKPRRPRKPTQNQIASNIAGILELGNATACELAPAFRPDALAPYEIELLSKAAAGEILANAALLKWYQSVGSQVTGPHTLAAAAIVAVALPRLARRRMVPERLAVMATGLAMGMSNVVGEGSVETDGPAVQDETRGTHSDNGADGLREVYVGPGAPGLAFVPADFEDETGRGPVRD